MSKRWIVSVRLEYGHDTYTATREFSDKELERSMFEPEIAVGDAAVFAYRDVVREAESDR